MTVTQAASGSEYRVDVLEASGVECAEARSIVSDFYSQTIGPSGSTVAQGFGFAYDTGGGQAAVAFRSRSGNGYEGDRQVRWREETLGARPARECGTVQTRRRLLPPVRTVGTGGAPAAPCR